MSVLSTAQTPIPNASCHCICCKRWGVPHQGPHTLESVTVLLHRICEEREICDKDLIDIQAKIRKIDMRLRSIASNLKTYDYDLLGAITLGQKLRLAVQEWDIYATWRAQLRGYRREAEEFIKANSGSSTSQTTTKNGWDLSLDDLPFAEQDKEDGGLD